MPPVVYLANKAEDGFEGDIHADFYAKFPQIKTALDPTTGEPVTPLFLSAEHGDGLPDLFRTIERFIPEGKADEHAERQERRVTRYLEFKQLLMDEIVEHKREEFEKE
jgi:hypothetical protein